MRILLGVLLDERGIHTHLSYNHKLQELFITSKTRYLCIILHNVCIVFFFRLSSSSLSTSTMALLAPRLGGWHNQPLRVPLVARLAPRLGAGCNRTLGRPLVPHLAPKLGGWTRLRRLVWFPFSGLGAGNN